MRKKIDKTIQNFKCKAKEKNHQPSQTSDSLGKIFTCHRERTNFVNALKNAYQKKKKKAQLKMAKDTYNL